MSKNKAKLGTFWPLLLLPLLFASSLLVARPAEGQAQCPIAAPEPEQSPTERLRGAVVDTAMSYVGTEEKPDGSNSGPMVDTFLAEGCGLGPGYEWCSCFVSYVYNQNDVAKPDYRTALSADWMDKARKENLIRARDISRGVATVPKGAVGTYERGDTGSGHTVLSRRKWEGQCGATVEGNVGDAVGTDRRCARPDKYFHLRGFYPPKASSNGASD